jgi:hypothetical protein
MMTEVHTVSNRCEEQEDTDLSAEEKNKLEANLRRLKSELQRLGESF